MIQLLQFMLLVAGFGGVAVFLTFITRLPRRNYSRTLTDAFPDRQFSISLKDGAVCRFTYQSVPVRLSMGQNRSQQDITIHFTSNRFPFRATAQKQRGTLGRFAYKRLGTLKHQAITISGLSEKGVAVVTDKPGRAKRYFASSEVQHSVTRLIEQRCDIILGPKGITLSTYRQGNDDLQTRDFQNLLRDGRMLVVEDKQEQIQNHEYDGLIRSLVCLFAIDTQISQEERQFLEALRKRHGVAQVVADEALTQAQIGKLSVHLPTDRAGREDLFDLLVRAAAADGTIAPQERKVVDAVASKIGLSDTDIDKRIARYLNGLPGSSQTASPSADALFICPKCSYQARVAGEPPTECPACRVIIAKYQRPTHKKS